MKAHSIQTAKQRGSSPLVIVLIVIVIGLVGYIGWQTYKDNQGPTTPATTAVQPKTTNTTSNTPPAAPAGPQKVVYSKAPAELQQAIYNYTAAKSPECVVNKQIVDVDKKATDQEIFYDATGAAFTGIGCEGTAMNLFVKRDAGHWEQVASTQFGFDCSLLKTNHVSLKLLALTNGEDAPKCLQGEGLVAYQP